MTEQDVNRAIAEAMGWAVREWGSGGSCKLTPMHKRPGTSRWRRLPDYAHSVDACLVVLNTILPEARIEFFHSGSGQFAVHITKWPLTCFAGGIHDSRELAMAHALLAVLEAEK